MADEKEDSIYRALRDLLINLGNDRAQVEAIKTTDDLVEDFGLDSLEVVEYAMAVEEHYGLSELTNEEMDQCTTLEKVRELVLSKTGRADCDPAPTKA